MVVAQFVVGQRVGADELNALVNGVNSGIAGGAIPVQDEGSEVVSTPTALNFVGGGVTVTDESSVATVDIPPGGAIPVQDEGSEVVAVFLQL